MTSPREELEESLAHCASCPACVSAAKEREAELLLRCRICLASFDEVWPVQSEVRPDLCRRCASAGPSKSGLGATHGRFDPMGGVDVPETPGGAA